MGAPRVHAEAALAAHPRQVGAVEDLEHEAEALLELVLPLLEDRRRRGDDDGLRLLAQQQLAGDEARLDRLAEAGVVGDEEVDARQPERLAQRLHLVGVDLDAGAERRLEEVRVGGGDAVPAQRVEEGRELARRVEALRGEVAPSPRPRGSGGRARSPRRPRATGPGRRRRRRRGGRAADWPGAAASTTSSTSQRRERTWTSSPSAGMRSGKNFVSFTLGTGSPCRAAAQIPSPRIPRSESESYTGKGLATYRPDSFEARCAAARRCG